MAESPDRQVLNSTDHQTTKPPRFLFLCAGLLWTLAIAGLGVWHYASSYNAFIENAQTAARYSLQKDLTYRHWATGHGGVYVPVSEQTPPNPYLAHLPERDLITPSGQVLTLVNPAYMTRQVHEMATHTFGSRGKITSLNLLRPENAPDAWEEQALYAFEAGAEEWSTVATMDNEMYVRLMRPFLIEEGCLKCHSHQGYQIGDIRGGISVAIPWAPYREELAAVIPNLAFSYGPIWLLGLIFVTLHRRKISEFLRRHQQAEAQLQQQRQQLEQRNTDLQRFNYTVSHDLKTPLVTIETFLGFLLEDLVDKNDTAINKDIGHIRAATTRMSQLLDNLLHITQIGFSDKPPTRTNFLVTAQKALTLVVGPITQRRIKINLTEADIPLSGDELHLIELWQNLIVNAVKFMGDQPQPRIDIGFDVSGEETVFHIRDNGIGIEAPFRIKIFGLFNQLDKNSPGNGLGLALVKQIVELYGGRVWVESAGDRQGSCFYFTLPNAIHTGEQP